ncbi:MAG: potassium channel family protein [Bacteroidota bacterium]
MIKLFIHIRKKLLLFIAIFFSLSVYSQGTNYKEYSYTEFIQLIQNEKDSVFKLEDALIKYNPKTDIRFKSRVSGFRKDSLYNIYDTIVVNKKIELNNVQLLANIYNEDGDSWTEGALRFIHFKEDVILNEVLSFNAEHCVFDKTFDSKLYECLYEDKYTFGNDYNSFRFNTFNIFNIEKNCYRFDQKIGWILMEYNRFLSKQPKRTFSVFAVKNNSVILRDNYIESKDRITLALYDMDYNIVAKNSFISEFANIYLENNIRVTFENNSFPPFVSFYIDELKSKDVIQWKQFSNKLASSFGITDYSLETTDLMFSGLDVEKKKEVKDIYLDSVRISNDDIYAREISLKGQFYKYYKSKYNTEVANKVYIELKDLETQRLEVKHQQNPRFFTYFTWKINQFLKVFSAYGTEPARAVVFSLYVILFFAFIYLLFPNSWDSLGKKRLMHRFEFFQKYLRRKEGMHTLYLEDKQQEISSYEEFKTNLEKAHLELPKFFITWSKPLYNASMFSSRITSRFLKLTDVLQGKWQDLTPKQKRWKNIQIGFLLIIGLLYDLFIKVLNALMLSINTFTTLGFGEIPIKGLPRYLAIIQGFIGWFMLTIFSVSLISQLLN